MSGCSLAMIGQRFGDGGAGAHHAEVGLSLQQPAEAVPEQAVIVHQQNPDFLGHSSLSDYAVGDAGESSTTKIAPRGSGS